MIPTQDASARKKEIDEKLKQEQDTLSFIRENLEKSDQLTKGMVSILSSFESRLMQLENSIIPVHKQTENLQRLQDNVDKTLSCMDHVISYYHVAKDTDKIIKEGPSGRLDEYLACIAKIQKAVEYFQDNNPDSPELNTVKVRFEKGKELLEAEFHSLLTRYSKPVPPILILDLIGADDELDTQEEVTLDHLPETVLQDIICISGWLVEYGRNQDFMNVYFQIRSSQLDRSVKSLKEHFRKSSSSSGVLYSPAMQNKRKDTPTKKPPKRPGKDDVLDIEIDSYIHCISAFVKLAQSEYQLLTDIIPEHHQKKTFDSLIQEALDNLMLEGDNVVSAARRAIMRHDYSAVLTIFPILKHLKQTKPEFDQVLQGTAASTKNKLPSLITSMETIGAKALEEFADSIKNDPDKEYNMPKDGTVHELTSNAILFLQQLLDFQETAGAMLASQGHDHDLRVKHLSDALNERHGAAAGKDDVLDIEIDSYIHCISAFVKLAQSEYQLLTDIIPEHHQKKTFDSLIQVREDDVLDIEIDSYIHCISAFVKLAQSEYQLLTDIIPEHHQKKTFDSLIQEALDNLMLEGDNVVSAARRAIMRHDYSAVLTIFPILKHLKQTKPEFDQVLQGTAASTKNKLPSLITSMETIGAKALEEFADSIKNDPDKEYNMPKDGTVHELTSNAILFLQQLLDFQETAGAMLASQGKVLGNLQLNLLSKSKVYEDTALSAIFLHNNYNYTLKSLEKSELIQLVSVTQRKAETQYRELIEQQIQSYQRSWLKVTEYITDRNMPAFQPGAKLKDKERQMIKDKFKGFNDGLEELCKIQKVWAIPDKDQRDAIRQAQKRMITQAYRAFLQRYTNISFTKNPEKYHKYRPEQVEAMIERLFDTSA
ncbi:UNVERIFIED_CONTAM: hypothetical protein FKN15_059884 [Acipenser sinensis]